MSFSNRPPYFKDRRDSFSRQGTRFNGRDDHKFRFDHHNNRHPPRDVFNGPVHCQRGRVENRPMPRQHDPPRHRHEDRPPPNAPGFISRPPRPNQTTPSKNSFSKFRNLEEFKDFRRLQKIRKSMEDDDGSPNKKRKENNSDDFIFISPIEIKELKDELYITIRKHPQNVGGVVEELCQQFSRFQYHLCYKDYNNAKVLSRKKNQIPKEDVYFSCMPCDCYFTDKNILDIHLHSCLHQQISKIYNEVINLGKDYMDFYTNTTNMLKEGPIAEKVGVLVRLNDEKADYSFMDATKSERDSFVLSALEKAMKKFWPHPKSQYFCRCCNYSEFASQGLLDRHMQSARHLEFDRHYKDAFCIVCQHHYGDIQQMRTHVETAAHRKASHLMEFTKKHATEYWNYWHDKDFDMMLNFNNSESDRFHSIGVNSDNNVYNETDFQENRLRIPFVDEYESPQRQTLSNDNNALAMKKVVEENVYEKVPDITENNQVDTVPDEKPPIDRPKDPSSLDIEVYKEYALKNSQTSNSSKEDDKEMNKNTVIAESEKELNDLDEYIVPLTGFMCTVCHETLSNIKDAIAHKETNNHKSNVKTHTLLFGP